MVSCARAAVTRKSQKLKADKGRDRETARERQRQRDRETARERQRETERQRDRETARERQERQRETEKQPERDRAFRAVLCRAEAAHTTPGPCRLRLQADSKHALACAVGPTTEWPCKELDETGIMCAQSKRCTHTHTHTHTHTLTHSLTHSLAHTHTHTLTMRRVVMFTTSTLVASSKSINPLNTFGFPSTAL